MKVIFKSFIFLILLLIIFIFYLSTFGIETNKFNSQISKKITNIDENLKVELKKIKLVLDPLKLKLNIKTVGTNLRNNDKIIQIENIKSKISLKSLIEKEFSVENLEISTKSLEIKNLISFIRSFRNTPELFLLEKTIKNGYLIADISLEFDRDGKIRNNYEIKGFIKDIKLNILKRYNFQKLNLIFEYKKDDLILNDIIFSLNNLNFSSEKISIKKINDNFLFDGDLNNNKFDLNEENTNLFVKPFLPKVKIEKLSLSSNNKFSFKFDKKYKFEDFKLISNLIIDELRIKNEFNLTNYLPDIQENIKFLNHKMSIQYVKDKDNLDISGKGNILLQNSDDEFTYSIQKKKSHLDFKSLYKLSNDIFEIDFLNYKKNKKDEATINLEGSLSDKNEILIKLFSLHEKKNKIEIKDLYLNKDFEIYKLIELNLDYIDIEKQKNQAKFYFSKNQYQLIGSNFNANKLIDDLLIKDKSSNIIKLQKKINIKIDKVRLDDYYNLSNFNGHINMKNDQIIKANLNGNFSNNKKFKFTINSVGNEKITTLYVDKAEPLVKRYKFIKGFDEGYLDFNSSKKFDESISQLKIYDFKLKELPALTKILTLASLQGIADILSGEGIRFEEFEMNFRNKGSLMTIDEIYAIGPAISILMEGYIEKNKLVSLRGSLVPATTINKAIGTIPVLGKILVGSKTGEGVFGVSFKIKGSPKDLETTVNPIKTLTPRFITRTLEKIKKN